MTSGAPPQPYVIAGRLYAALRVSGRGVDPAVYEDIAVEEGTTYTFCLLTYSVWGGQARIAITTRDGSSLLRVIGIPQGPLPAFYRAASDANVASAQTALSRWQVLYGTFMVPYGVYTARVALEDAGRPPAAPAFFQAVQILEGVRLRDYSGY